MSIVVLSDIRRIPRQVKIRLGERRKNERGREYPKETDYFVLRPEDGATPEIMRLYGGKVKEVKMMLLTDVDDADPQNGNGLSWDLHNLAYGSGHGLKCKGTGYTAEDFGSAQATEEGWANRIGQATGIAPVQLPGGRWQVRCNGRNCVKYHSTAADGNGMAQGHDKDAACRAVVKLRALLIHPATDTASPDYCRALAVAEIVSGSRNAMIDVRSSFDLMRAYTSGRTAAIPFMLTRRPMTTYSATGGKQIHYPCTILQTPQEWQRFAHIPPSQVFLSDTMRQELAWGALGHHDPSAFRDQVRWSCVELLGLERAEAEEIVAGGMVVQRYVIVEEAQGEPYYRWGSQAAPVTAADPEAQPVTLLELA